MSTDTHPNDPAPRADTAAGGTPALAEETEAGRAMQAADAFDLRRILAGLFLLYGVILVVVGLGDSQAEIDKAAGVHINLYAGIGMLVVGALFLTWALLRPLSRQLDQAELGPRG